MKSTYQYRERDYAFGNLCLTLRTRIGVAQGELARLLKASGRTIQAWEGGDSYPKVDVLKRFIELCVQHQAFAAGREADEIRALWHAAHQRVLLDEGWLRALLAPATDVQEAAGVARQVTDETVTAPGATGTRMPAPPPASQPRMRIDWVGALDVSAFQGREVELAELSQGMVQERCRLIAILGMGGIGKSALISLMGRQLVSQFEAVLWRSVRDAPSCEELVADCITFCSETPPAEFSSSLEQRINQLVARLQARRCLLVLDNLETLLQEGDPEGNYRPGYEGYGRLIQRLGESAHQSCVVLTSREKPKEIESLEGPRTPVRSLRLSGLSEEAARSLLQDKDLRGESAVWLQLIATYAGNPLALKIVGQAIVDLFGGDIEEFLQSGELIFNGIRAVLRQQVARLTPLEQTLLTWLAVVREWTSLDTLLSLQVPRAMRGRVLEALEALSRRSLIERGQQASFTLQSVVMEYVTDALLDQLTEEIVTETADRLRRYALEQAQAKDYVRQTQVRLLVRPLTERLQYELGRDVLVEEHLLRLLDRFRTEDANTQGYGPANVISLLKELRGDLCGLDLSRLCIRGANLQGVEMQDTSLADSTLHDTAFIDAFDAQWSVVISGDGRYWAAGSIDGEVRVWRDGGQVFHLVLRAHADCVPTLAFSPDGQVLASGSWDGSINLWDVPGGVLRWTRRQIDSIQSLAFAPDGRLLVSGSDDATIRLWDPHTGECLQTLEGHEGPVSNVTWSPDGKFLASGGFDRMIRVWDIQGTQQGVCRQMLVGHDNWLHGLAFSPDGRELASGSLDQTVRLWNAESGYCQHVLRHAAEVHNLAFTPDGSILLSASDDRTLRAWDAVSGQCVHIMQGYAVSLFDVAWSPDGLQLASAGNDTTLTLWSVTDGSLLKVLRGHDYLVHGVAWSPDRRQLASASWDKTVRIWDAISGECVWVFRDSTHLFYSVAWSPDGRWLAGGSYLRDLCVWEVSEGIRRWVGQAHTNTVRRVAWSPDGTTLASCSDDGTIRLWQVEDGMVLRILRGHNGKVTGVTWNPDGTRLASCGGGSSGELFLWDASSGKRVRNFAGHASMVNAVAWDPTGDLLVSGGSDGTLRCWDVRSGECLYIRQGHQGWTLAVSISPDGNTVVSCGDDGAILLWDLREANLLRLLRRDRPYERLNITGIAGLSEAQKITLQTMGAVESQLQP